MVKGFRQIALLTAASRVMGMVRDMAFAYFLGASGLFDGWAIAFKIPNLARRVFGEGAAAASFIPVYSEELHHRPESANKLACTVVTVVFVLLAVVVLIGEGIIWGYYCFFRELAGTDLKLALSGIMLPYMVLICVVAILAGILQTHRHFAMPAAAPMVLNIFIIGSLCFSGWVMSVRPDRQVFVVAATVIVAGLVQLFMQFLPMRRHGVELRPAWQIRSQAFKKILFLMGPMILGITVTQINTLADDFIALWLSGSAEKGTYFTAFGRHLRYPLWEGAVSHLYYSQRLYQFPLGVFGISLATAIFPVMSADAARKDIGALSATISRGLRSCVFVAVPATVGIFLVAKPLVSALFEHGEFDQGDTPIVAWTLACYAIGLCGYFAQQILTRAFYSLQDSKTPANSAVAAVCVNIVLNLTLIWPMGTRGLALSTAICSYLQVFILVSVLGVGQAFVKTLAATLVMFVVGGGVLYLLGGLAHTRAYNVLRVALVVPFACVAYAAAAKLLGIEMLSLLTGRGQSEAGLPADGD
jgi:putative peptidoglycan lipid II flippase